MFAIKELKQFNPWDDFDRDDGLAPARGIVISCAIGIFAWVAVLATVVLVVRLL